VLEPRYASLTFTRLYHTASGSKSVAVYLGSASMLALYCHELHQRLPVCDASCAGWGDFDLTPRRARLFFGKRVRAERWPRTAQIVPSIFIAEGSA
jgi:hypothetical protein